MSRGRIILVQGPYKIVGMRQLLGIGNAQKENGNEGAVMKMKEDNCIKVA